MTGRIAAAGVVRRGPVVAMEHVWDDGRGEREVAVGMMGEGEGVGAMLVVTANREVGVVVVPGERGEWERVERPRARAAVMDLKPMH